MRINTNTAAMNTYSNLTSANASKSSSLAKLSSGLRINKAGDDAAGLAISEKMKNQVSGMTQATRNAQDGISLIQTAEGALSETHSILNRMRDLTVQSGNGTNTDDDKAAIQKEITSLTAEIDRIAGDTEFNTKGLMNGESDFTDGELDKLAVAYNTKVGGATGLGINEGVVLAATFETEVDSLSANDQNRLMDLYNSNTTADKKVKDIAGLKAAFGTDGTSAEGVKVKESMVKFNDQFRIDKNDLQNVSKLDSATLNDTIDDLVAGTVTDKNGVDLTSTDQLEQSGKSKFTFQIGANSGEQISVEIGNMSAKGLGISGIDVSASNGSNVNTDDILKTLDNAISEVSTQRAELGATQNRLDHTVSNLTTTKENLSEANSRITDVDMAEEMMSFTKSNILSQASTSMLAQANQMPQSVLSLLQ